MSTGASVRPVLLLVACTLLTASADAAWQYKPGNLWQNFTVYGLNAQGLAAMEGNSDTKTRAARYFQQALRVRENDYTALVGLARSYNVSGRYDDAINQLTFAMHAWPESAELHLERADVELSRGYSDAAMASAQRALELDAQNDEAYVVMGRVLEKRGETDRAIECYRSAIGFNPRSIRGHNYLAVLLYNKGRTLEMQHKDELVQPIYEEVAKELSIVASLNDRYFPVYMSTGAILTNMGAYEKAEIAFRNAVFLSPHNVDALTSLGMIEIKLKNPDRALGCLGEAFEIDRTSPRTNFFIGYAMSEKGELETALFYLERAVHYDAEKNHGNVDSNFLKKYREVKARLAASTQPATSP